MSILAACQLSGIVARVGGRTDGDTGAEGPESQGGDAGCVAGGRTWTRQVAGSTGDCGAAAGRAEHEWMVLVMRGEKPSAWPSTGETERCFVGTACGSGPPGEAGSHQRATTTDLPGRDRGGLAACGTRQPTARDCLEVSGDLTRIGMWAVATGARGGVFGMCRGAAGDVHCSTRGGVVGMCCGAAGDVRRGGRPTALAPRLGLLPRPAPAGSKALPRPMACMECTARRCDRRALNSASCSSSSSNSAGETAFAGLSSGLGLDSALEASRCLGGATLRSHERSLLVCLAHSRTKVQWRWSRLPVSAPASPASRPGSSAPAASLPAASSSCHLPSAGWMSHLLVWRKAFSRRGAASMRPHAGPRPARTFGPRAPELKPK
mmetsp:Transcript_34982/g.96727  ORF Transcript_34982/g.96727 Transcript_34982/m.96727 type:complete len:378 (-) Transcript_34982:8-1141(-)